MNALGRYFTNLGRALSRLGNAIIGGYSGEMFSARCYRRGWWLEWVVNWVFWWEINHCHDCWETELLDRDRPEEYRCPELLSEKK